VATEHFPSRLNASQVRYVLTTIIINSIIIIIVILIIFIIIGYVSAEVVNRSTYDQLALTKIFASARKEKRLYDPRVFTTEGEGKSFFVEELATLTLLNEMSELSPTGDVVFYLEVTVIGEVALIFTLLNVHITYKYNIYI